MCVLRGVLLKAVRGGGDPYILLFSTQGGGGSTVGAGETMVGIPPHGGWRILCVKKWFG